MNRYKLLFAFDHDRNMALLDFLAKAKDPHEEVWRRLAHVIAAKTLWYQRITRQPVTTAPWPEWGRELLRIKAEESYRNWTALLMELKDADLQVSVQYLDLNGNAHNRPLVSLLDHLLLHGSQHRGQVTMLLSMQGMTPPRVDFVASELSH